MDKNRKQKTELLKGKVKFDLLHIYIETPLFRFHFPFSSALSGMIFPGSTGIEIARSRTDDD